LGIDKIATGHYARVRYDSTLDRFQLLRAIDDTKDQSYFLYDLTQELLSHLILPLGEQTKTQTRAMATKFELKTADKPDSQDLCLIESHGSMKDFLDKYIQPKQGYIVDLDGHVLGEHTGIHHYTIGQRKGLGVAYSEPLYVVKLDPVMNQVIVATREQGGNTECTVSRMNWVSIALPQSPIKAEAKIRYRTPAKNVNVIPLEDNRVKLIFDEPQFGITPGQAAVLYHQDLLLGGGIIDK